MGAGTPFGDFSLPPPIYRLEQLGGQEKIGIRSERVQEERRPGTERDYKVWKERRPGTEDKEKYRVLEQN